MGFSCMFDVQYCIVVVESVILMKNKNKVGLRTELSWVVKMSHKYRHWYSEPLLHTVLLRSNTLARLFCEIINLESRVTGLLSLVDTL